MIRPILLLAVAAIAKADIYDVTTIYRLRESNDGTQREILSIPECYAGTWTCVWHRTGMKTMDISDMYHKQDKVNREIHAGETSPFIPLSSEDNIVVSITPNITDDQEVFLYFTADESGLLTTDMLVLQLKAGNKSRDNRAYYCFSSYTKNSVQLHLPNKVIRNCDQLSLPITTSTENKTHGSLESESYRIEYSPVTHDLNVTKMVGSIQTEEYFLEAKYQIFDLNYLAVSPKESSLNYRSILYGLKLTEDRGTLVSPNMMTKNSSRLCLKVTATRRASLKVSAVFTGTSLDLGGTFGEVTGSAYETSSWSFLADLSSYKEQKFNIQVQVMGYSFPVIVTGISDCDSSENRTMVVSDPGIGEVHARGNARGHVYRLPNGTVAGANANQTFSECTAAKNRCQRWSIDKQWSRKRTIKETITIISGLNHRTEWIENNISAINDFVDNVQISLKGDFNKNKNSSITIYLLNTEDIKTSNMFLIVFDKKNTESVLFLWCGDDSSNTEIVYLTKSISRKCKRIKKDVSNSDPESQKETSQDEDYSIQSSDVETTTTATSDSLPESPTETPQEGYYFEQSNEVETTTTATSDSLPESPTETPQEGYYSEQSNEVETTTTATSDSLPESPTETPKEGYYSEQSNEVTTNLDDTTSVPPTHRRRRSPEPPVDSEETKVHDFNVQVVGEMDNRIITLKGKVFGDNGYEATFKPSSNFNVSHYQVGVHNGSGFIESSGTGSPLFSLESTESAITGSFPPISERLCLELIYFMDKAHIENYIEITGEFRNSPFRFIREPEKLKVSEWAKVKYIYCLGNTTDQENNVTVAIKFTKSEGSKMLIRRISDCSQGEEDITVLFEDVSFIARGSGANVANMDYGSVGSDQVSPIRCFNGGKFYERHGCDCPSGFSGASCEKGCGPNRYGADCGGECSDTTRGCRGMVMCRPMLGCDCATGYTGPFCDEPCTGKNYGAGCKQSCGHCAKGQSCDIFTGVCHQGCEPGYKSPNCLEGNPQLNDKPDVHTIKETSARVKIHFGNGTGFEAVKFSQIQYKMKKAIEWQRQELQVVPEKPSGSSDAGNLTNLQPGSRYLVRVVLIYQSNGQIQSENVQESSFTTECKVPAYPEYNMQVSAIKNEVGLIITWQLVGDAAEECIVTAYEIHVARKWRWTRYTINNSSLTEPCTYSITGLLAGSQYRVKIRAITNKGPMQFSETVLFNVIGMGEPSTVTNLLVMDKAKERTFSVVWKAPRFTTADSVMKYNIKIECVEYISCPQMPCNDTKTVKGLTDLVKTYHKDKLLAHAIYNISVAAVATKGGFENVTGPWSSVLYTSGERAPGTKPTNGVQLPSKIETSLRVQWKPPAAENCHLVNGVLRAYRCQLTGQDDGKVQKDLNTTQNFAKFERVKPNYKYIVKVYIVTSAGQNETEFLSIVAKTRAQSPNPVNGLAVYMKGRKMLALRWSEPDRKEGASEIDYYKVSYKSVKHGHDGSIRVKPRNSKCLAYEDMICARLENLRSQTEYTIEVTAHSTENETSSARTTLGIMKSDMAPTPPQKLEILNIRNGTCTIQWTMPDMLNGELKRFEIIIEHLELDDALGECCEEIKTRTEPSNGSTPVEKMQYNIEISDLKLRSKYEVSVIAVTSKYRSEPILRIFET